MLEVSTQRGFGWFPSFNCGEFMGFSSQRDILLMRQPWYILTQYVWQCWIEGFFSSFLLLRERENYMKVCSSWSVVQRFNKFVGFFFSNWKDLCLLFWDIWNVDYSYSYASIHYVCDKLFFHIEWAFLHSVMPALNLSDILMIIHAFSIYSSTCCRSPMS